MAPRRKSEKPGYGKILDAWARPRNAGNPVGCVATTFTFAADFFEEECLARFLGLESEPDEDGIVYLIEREEKLAQVACATALVDGHHCQGLRNLRWDLVPVRVPGAILHAKVSLLCWTERTRLIVASANLTEDGYRRNLEVFGVLDYHLGSESPLTCLRETVDFLREVARFTQADLREPSPALTRLTTLLDRAYETPADWGREDGATKRGDVRVRTVFTGPGMPDAFDTLANAWTAASPATEAYALSPFFDAPGQHNRPAERLWGLLRQRGGADVAFYTTAEEIGEDAILFHAPESLLEAQPSGRKNVRTVFRQVNLERSRPLHAKSLSLEDGRRVVYMIGSSNFTSAGFGLSPRSNLEANLAYCVDSKRNPHARRALDDAFPENTELDPAKKVRWLTDRQMGTDEPGEEIALPVAFDTAEYDVIKGQQARIAFRFAGPPPPDWTVRTDENNEVFFSERKWQGLGSSSTVRLPWDQARPPSGFWVSWQETVGRAWWPVNVASTAALPPPSELKDLPLEVLIDILTAARPLHIVIGPGPTRGERDESKSESVDPHKQVDTTQFLLQRTRRISWALKALGERLERPVSTEQALDWRLRGPVGVMAVAEAVKREARSEEEQAFLISELALEMARVKPGSAPGCLPAKRVGEAIQSVVAELRKLVPSRMSRPFADLEDYVRKVFDEVMR